MQGFKYHSKSTKQVQIKEVNPADESPIHPSLYTIGLYVTNQDKPYISTTKREEIARVKSSPKSKIDNKMSEKLTPKRAYYRAESDMSRNDSKGPIHIQGSGSVQKSLNESRGSSSSPNKRSNSPNPREKTHLLIEENNEKKIKDELQDLKKLKQKLQ